MKDGKDGPFGRLGTVWMQRRSAPIHDGAEVPWNIQTRAKKQRSRICKTCSARPVALACTRADHSCGWTWHRRRAWPVRMSWNRCSGMHRNHAPAGCQAVAAACPRDPCHIGIQTALCCHLLHSAPGDQHLRRHGMAAAAALYKPQLGTFTVSRRYRAVHVWTLEPPNLSLGIKSKQALHAVRSRKHEKPAPQHRDGKCNLEGSGVAFATCGS